MGFFRRAKPLHEQLAELGDLDIGPEGGDGEPGPRTPSRLAGVMHGLAVALHGVPPPREGETVATVAAELPGGEVHVTSLPDGTLLVEEDVPDGALSPLADAIEASINPPYYAEGVRRDDALWAVGAKRIEVRSIPGHEEDELELVEDGQFVIGRRLDGDLFEVRVSPV